jgi:hypothetical protein
MYRNLLLSSLYALSLFIASSGVAVATEAGNEELKQLAKTLLDLPAVEAQMDVVLSGEALNEKPNIPRNGKITLAIDGSVKDDVKRKLSVSVNTIKGMVDFSFLTLNDSFYLNLYAPEQPPLAYYFDPANSQAKKNNPMLSGILGQAKNASSLDSEAKANGAVKKLSEKAEISLVRKGHLSIKVAKNPDNTFDIFYDSASYLPQKVEVFQPEKKLKVVIGFTKWTTTGPVDTKLPAPQSTYTLFGMEHLAKIVSTLPKANEILAPRSENVLNPDSAKITAASLPIEDDGETIDEETDLPSQAETAHSELLAEVKESTQEMRKIVNTLRDPDFKQTLLKLHLRLNRIERHIKALEQMSPSSAIEENK